MFQERISWSEAKKYCEKIGGHLVTITSSGENSVVAKLANGGRYWIGATDKNNEGTWEWVTGENMNYSNWDESTAEPNGGDSENYAVTWGTSTAVWNDLSNDSWEQDGFICEID